MNNEETFLQPIPVAQASEEARSRFIVRTYNHLFGAITLFTLIEIGLFQSGIADRMAPILAGNWLWVLGGFMIIGWLSSRAAASAKSLGSQYLALIGFVAAEAIIFVPLLWYANQQSIAQFGDGGAIITRAAGITILGCTGLTLVAFITRKDFSFLRGLLRWGGMLALILIGLGIFGLVNLGTWFAVGMIGFAGAAVLYDTSNVLHHYEEDRYVAASLQLFASIALMFYYVLMLFTSRR
ncbi:MAG: Bax inhibitor-1 family protein [Pirellulales bacterium]|nr:Bax inhibitor-1 family protein [Pirellulales bacterium]